MRRTSRLLVLFGIGLAVLTFVLIVALLPGSNGSGGIGSKPTPTPPANVTVVTAAADIPLGTVVTVAMLGATTLPANAVEPDTYLDKSQVIGQIARQAILTGAQVRAADFNPTQAVTQLQVPAGKRALAIAVNELTGVGKLVNPGDYVDVVITLSANAVKVVTVQPPAKSPYAYDATADATTVKAPLLLQGIQVLATIDQAVAQSGTGNANAQPTPTAAPSGAAFYGTANPTQKLIILAVTDSQAEAILFARTAGTIDLVLRSPADGATTAATSGVILKTMFNTYGVLPPYLIKAIDAYIAQQP